MKKLTLISFALAVLALAGCSSVPQLESQILPATVPEVKAKIKEAVAKNSITRPTIVQDTNERLHFRWEVMLEGEKAQIDLAYMFAAAENGTRVSLLENHASTQMNSEGKLVTSDTTTEVTAFGPNLREMRAWFFDRATAQRQ
ncbi:MAG: lipoprotein [Candidatus Didemnitutus sp.]|nr:lipoprotein [Candidatus Didemnitutus sp.]